MKRRSIFDKEGVTDNDGKLTEAGKERMLATVFEVASEGIYKSAMRGAIAAKKAERDLKKIGKESKKAKKASK